MESIIEQKEVSSEIEFKDNQELQAKLYEQVFNLVSQIISHTSDKNGQLFLMRIIQKIIQNIAEKTMRKEDTEKFRRLKLSNPNIEKFFKVTDAYAFVTSIGFTEKAIDNELYLYLEENKVNQNLYCILSYLNLLIMKEEDVGSSHFETKENSNSCIKSNQIDKSSPSKTYYKKAGIVDILKSSKDIRLGKAVDLPENYDKILHIEKAEKEDKGSNNNPSLSSSVISNNDIKNPVPNKITIVINPPAPQKDIKAILKETASIRKENALNPKPNGNDNETAKDLSKEVGKSKDSKGNRNEQPIKNVPREMSLKDLTFDNPDLNKPSVVKDDMGKRCLELTNDFRVKNNLPKLAWDDEVWVVAYGHSKNMGNHVVKIGHDGFSQRITQWSFHSSLSAENVFGVMGFTPDLPKQAVNGWINSPGHCANLLTYTTHCAIASFQNTLGESFFTQIFVKKW